MSKKPYETVEEFLDARDEALRSGDIEQLRAHLIRGGVLGAKDTPEKVLRISLHKCRVHWRGCPPELLYESVWWLLDHDYSLMMDETGARVPDELKDARERGDVG